MAILSYGSVYNKFYMSAQIQFESQFVQKTLILLLIGLCIIIFYYKLFWQHAVYVCAADWVAHAGKWKI